MNEPKKYITIGEQVLNFMDEHDVIEYSENSKGFVTDFNKVELLSSYLKKVIKDINNKTVIIGDLMWSRESYSSGDICSWEEAKSAAIYCKLADFKDWRLPTVRELVSIVDYNRTNPAIHLSLFDYYPNGEGYWTSTECVTGSKEHEGNSAWGIYFATGGVLIYEKTDLLNVRLVRNFI